MIAFPKRSIAGAKREIFSVAGQGPIRITKKTRIFGDSRKRESRFFYSAPYSPDRNPDELAGKHLEAATAGRMAISVQGRLQAPGS